MTKDEALRLALVALGEYSEYEGATTAECRATAAIKEALAQPDTDMSYTIALQRAIEWHCDGKAVPPDVAEVCPYHSEKLNTALAQEQWTPEDTAYRPGGLAQPDHPEQMARLGWQYFECPACGSAGARAFPKPEQEPVAWGFQNSAITGSNRWMMLREDIPTDDQYGGALWTPLYTSPPKRQPLTTEQIKHMLELFVVPPQHREMVVRTIEAAHGIGDKT